MRKSFYLLPTCIICFFTFSFFSNCNKAVSYKSPAGYDFSKPEKFELASALNEISGIAFKNENSDSVLAIEDEDGKLYTYSLSSKNFRRSKFGKKGDYEDWIEKLTMVINDKELAAKMGNLGRKFIEDNFSWEIMAKGFLKIVQEHINKK